MRLKICGLHPARDVQLCIDLGVNFLGFVFYKKSPRNINFEDVKKLNKYEKQNSSFVAVTVDPNDDFIKNQEASFAQLYGSPYSDYDEFNKKWLQSHQQLRTLNNHIASNNEKLLSHSTLPPSEFSSTNTIIPSFEEGI